MQDNYNTGMFKRFLFPSLVSIAGLALGNIVDALVVGVKMGETGLAAISLACPIFMAFNVFDVGLGLGASTRCAQLMGEGRAKAAVQHFNLCWAPPCSLAVSLPWGGWWDFRGLSGPWGPRRSRFACGK